MNEGRDGGEEAREVLPEGDDDVGGLPLPAFPPLVFVRFLRLFGVMGKSGKMSFRAILTRGSSGRPLHPYCNLSQSCPV